MEISVPKAESTEPEAETSCGWLDVGLCGWDYVWVWRRVVGSGYWSDEQGEEVFKISSGSPTVAID